MFPDANIPVLQISLDYTKAPQYHYDLAKQLSWLRRKGVLIIGSGNIVHNLGMVAWNKIREPEFGFDWALEAREKISGLINNADHDFSDHWKRKLITFGGFLLADQETRSDRDQPDQT